MDQCERRIIESELSLIVIAGSTTSATDRNHIDMYIKNLPNDYIISLKDDDTDVFVTSSNSVNVSLNWDKNETDGFIIGHLNNFREISILFDNIRFVDNIYIFSSSNLITLPIYNNITINTINNEYYINNRIIKPYSSVKSALEFYGYYNFSSSATQQIVNGISLILYSHTINIPTCEKRREPSIDCEDVIPLPTQEEVDTLLELKKKKIISDIKIKNIDRCKQLNFMRCGYNLAPIDCSPFRQLPTWIKYQYTIPMWWENHNTISYYDCTTSLPVENCENSYLYSNFLRVNIIGGDGNDVVYSIPKGIYCNKTGEYQFKIGQRIKLIIEPSNNYCVNTCIGCDRFNNNIAELTFQGSCVVSFYLKPDGYNLSIITIGNGIVISLSSPNIRCGRRCVSKFPINSDVLLRAIPDFGYDFKEWSGENLSTDILYTVDMTSDKELTATFIPAVLTLFLKLVGPGSVKLNSLDLLYSADFQKDFAFEEVVSLSAISNLDSNFVGWVGDINHAIDPTISELSIKMNIDRYITAIFSISPILTIQIPKPYGIVKFKDKTCNSTCSNTLYLNENILIRVETYNGYDLNYWSGDISSFDNPLTLIMDISKTIIVNFIRVETAFLNIIILGFGSIRITSILFDQEVNVSSTYEFNKNREVTLEIISGNFIGWTGNIESLDNKITFKMDFEKDIICVYDISSVCGQTITSDNISYLYMGSFSLIDVSETFNFVFDPHTVPDRLMVCNSIIDPNHTYEDFITGNLQSVIFDTGWVCDFPNLYPDDNVSRQSPIYTLNRSLFSSSFITIVILSWLDDQPGWNLNLGC